jgi:putative NADH-flavin reductase
MKLALLGVTGPSGRVLINAALARSHQITIHARTPSKLDPSLTSNPNVTVIQGTLDDEDSLRRAFRKQDAVLSFLGPSPRHTVNDHLFTDAFKLVFSSMKAEHVTRFVGTGIPTDTEPKDQFSIALWLQSWYVWLFMRTIYRDVRGYTAVVAKEEDIEWSWFRVMIVNSRPGTGKALFGYAGDGKMSFGFIRREDLAEAMLDEITERQWVKQMPMIRTA